jgi:5-methylcytosine-specific restriction endonuclease McrA
MKPSKKSANIMYCPVPCKNGHLCGRYINSGDCIQCKKERSKISRAKTGATKSERHKLAKKAWRQKNKEKIRIYAKSRKARNRGAVGFYTEHHVSMIYESQNGKCTYCSCDIRKGFMHVDHIYPIYLGGSNWPSNLQLLCPSCNMRKGIKTHEEFLSYLALVGERNAASERK